MAQFMKFIYGILTIFIGSFLFTGILENYKNDAEVRSLLVENYYIPARNSMTQCLSKHSDYINAYSDYLGTQELMYQELKRMKEDSKLVNNFDYALWMKTLLEKHSDTAPHAHRRAQSHHAERQGSPSPRKWPRQQAGWPRPRRQNTGPLFQHRPRVQACRLAARRDCPPALPPLPVLLLR